MKAKNMDEERALTGKELEEDNEIEMSLRPSNFDQFVGQTQLINNLKTYIKATTLREEVLDHVLLSGPPGLGKTTLARIISCELGAHITITSGPVLKIAGDLAGILTNLAHGDILFIDEIHRLYPAVEEFLYSAMEDFSIDIMIDQGPSARSVNLKLKPFTLIGATTREGLLSAPFRARFLIHEKMSLYPTEDLLKIVKRSASILKCEITDEGASLISGRCRGTPRVANRFLRRIRDVAQVHTETGLIEKKIAMQGLKMLGVDEKGLDKTDRRILQTIIDYGGGPVGLKTLAVAVSEEEDSIESVYEPFLIQEGYLLKTSRGRKITIKGYDAMGVEHTQETSLFDNLR